MKTQAIYNVRMPDYALPYLINGDSSGLNPEEVKSIGRYMQEFYDLADSYNGSVIINPTEEESNFTWSPAFGLACDCIDTDILIVS